MSLLFLTLSSLFFLNPVSYFLPITYLTRLSPFSYLPLTRTHPTYNSLYKSCHHGLDASGNNNNIIAEAAVAEAAERPAVRRLEEGRTTTRRRRRRRGRCGVAPTDAFFIAIFGILLGVNDVVVNANANNANNNNNGLSLSLSLTLENFGPSKFESLFYCIAVSDEKDAKIKPVPIPSLSFFCRS